MIARLHGGPLSISDLGAPFGMTLAAIGKHVASLESAGIVRTHKQGRVRTCSLDEQALGLAQSWIAARRAEWDGRVERFQAYVETLNSDGDRNG